MSIDRYMKRMVKQTALYWGAPTPITGGKFTFPDPVEITVRWHEKSELLRTNDGREITSRAVVYPTQELTDKGMLFLGDLDDISSGQEVDPTKVKEAYEIIKFDKTPSLNRKNTYTYKAYI